MDLAESRHGSSSTKEDQALESEEADPTIRIIWPRHADTVDLLGELKTEATSPLPHLSTLRTWSAQIRLYRSHSTALRYKPHGDSNLLVGCIEEDQAHMIL